jgi:transposase
VHQPGAEAEVDFGEVVVRLRGEPVTCMLFAFRLSFSGKSVHRIFASGGQEAFLEGHVHAFSNLGGVPRRLVPDNLRTGVDKPNLYDPKINRSYGDLAAHSE